MALSPDGQFLATGEDGGLLRVFNTADGEPLTTVPMSADHDVNSSNRRVSSVAFSADGRRIVSGAMGDDSIREWDTMTGQQIAEMTGHTRDVTSVGFSSDSRYVVSGAFDSTVRIWNAPLSTRGVGVVRTAFSPDSRLVVAGLRDGTVRVWPGPAAWSEDLCATLTQNMSDADWAHWVGPGFAYKAPCEGLAKAPDGGSG
jgi:WD40 repeat protein